MSPVNTTVLAVWSRCWVGKGVVLLSSTGGGGGGWDMYVQCKLCNVHARRRKPAAGSSSITKLKNNLPYWVYSTVCVDALASGEYTVVSNPQNIMWALKGHSH
jgi:hypothetical protein